MPTLEIRDMPEDVYEALSLRAQSANRSPAEQAVAELSQGSDLLRRERRMKALAEIRKEIESEPPRHLPLDPAALIREDRDR